VNLQREERMNDMRLPIHLPYKVEITGERRKGHWGGAKTKNNNGKKMKTNSPDLREEKFQ
jgi:hypothetical protein